MPEPLPRPQRGATWSSYQIRIARATSAGSSICGECPHSSNICRVEWGNPRWNRPAASSGTMRSRRPQAIKTGQTISPTRAIVSSWLGGNRFLAAIRQAKRLPGGRSCSTINGVSSAAMWWRWKTVRSMLARTIRVSNPVLRSSQRHGPLSRRVPGQPPSSSMRPGSFWGCPAALISTKP